MNSEFLDMASEPRIIGCYELGKTPQWKVKG